MEDLYRLILEYHPSNEQEEKDRDLMLSYIKDHGESLLERVFPFHFTSSAWVTDESGLNVLMAYHKIYNSWAWLGGHADGNPDLKSVALTEAVEESGINPLKVNEKPVSLEILAVEGHLKKGSYVSSHLHLNLTFHIIADSASSLRISEDENSDVAWFSFEDAVAASNEAFFKEKIYPKFSSL